MACRSRAAESERIAGMQGMTGTSWCAVMRRFGKPAFLTGGRALLRRVQGVRHVFSRAPALPCGSFEEKRPIVNEDEPRMDTNKHE